MSTHSVCAPNSKRAGELITSNEDKRSAPKLRTSSQISQTANILIHMVEVVMTKTSRHCSHQSTLWQWPQGRMQQPDLLRLVHNLTSELSKYCVYPDWFCQILSYKSTRNSSILRKNSSGPILLSVDFRKLILLCFCQPVTFE